MSSHYIARRLLAGDTYISEEECLSGGGVIVVLAEPGAGKTDLLTSFANRVGANSYRASFFRNSASILKTDALIIDALDEVARQDELAVGEIIVKALEFGSRTVVFASRSSEWDKERTLYIRDFTGKAPSVVRLDPFNEAEQRSLFEHNFPGEAFDAFQTEAKQFGLDPVLGNPMFFRLFVEGYIQGGRRFHSKQQTFKDAADRLATDEGKSGRSTRRPPIAEIIATASELFAKLLLSGAAGIATTERPNDPDYPFISALSVRETGLLTAVLNSRLFKPATDADIHEPVHRIVAEYCAANYLAQRISDPSDNHLSLRRCLALIAPNSVVRDELRGLLGWLAALGDASVQRELIEIDPYAVLANGDAAQLTSGSKRLLLKELSALSAIDPYFRRTDLWRRFNVAGFFTNDILDELKLILTSPDNGSHLRDLMLELLWKTPAAGCLITELRAIMLDRTNDLSTRLLGRRCLAPVSSYNPAQGDFEKLLTEDGLDGARIASEFVIDGPPDPIAPELILELFRAIAQQPTANPRQQRDTAHFRYYIRQLIEALSLDEVTFLLDNLTAGLSCTCGAQQRFLCHCRQTISKIVGHLLDRYFELAPAKHDAQQLWRWMHHLKFERDISLRESVAAQALSEQADLRRSIQLLAFSNETDPQKIWETFCSINWSELHRGLCFTTEDIEAIVDHAFDADNVPLWSAFAHPHRRNFETKGPDALRAKMRAQARRKPEFMHEWSKQNRRWDNAARQERWPSRRRNRYERRNAAVREANRAHLNANRDQIEQGIHGGWNRQFAQLYLHFPDQLKEEVDDLATAERALDNSIPALAPHVPSLADLAQGRGRNIAEVLHAGCLVRFRKTGSLSGIDENVLLAVKAEAFSSSGYEEGEGDRFENEIDARLFRTNAHAEKFAREFIEPTLSNPAGTPTNVSWLRNKEGLEPVKAQLAAEWLEKYGAASIETTDSLFDICVSGCDQSWLIALIERRCDEMIALKTPNESEEQKSRRRFWFLRHFFFCPHDRDGIWHELLADPEGVFALEQQAGWMNRGDASGWPNLSAEKAYRILDAYIDVWPKVFLPSSWGSDSPKEEKAYRFLTEIVWQIGRDENLGRTISVINTMLKDPRFADFRNDLRSMKASNIRKKALRDFTLPLPVEVASLIDNGGIATVEDLRALLLEELIATQKWLKGAETDPLDTFWPNNKRVDENTARNRIVDHLQGRLEKVNAGVAIEHHMAQGNRCDFTATKMIRGHRRLLVCEVKGQWHPELYTAASAQLDERYASHPDAAQQGIFLVLWFGPDEKVAGRKKHNIKSPQDLHEAILEAMPVELQGFIDVFVLDLSKD